METETPNRLARRVCLALLATLAALLVVSYEYRKPQYELELRPTVRDGKTVVELKRVESE